MAAPVPASPTAVPGAAPGMFGSWAQALQAALGQQPGMLPNAAGGPLPPDVQPVGGAASPPPAAPPLQNLLGKGGSPGVPAGPTASPAPTPTASPGMLSPPPYAQMGPRPQAPGPVYDGGDRLMRFTPQTGAIPRDVPGWVGGPPPGGGTPPPPGGGTPPPDVIPPGWEVTPLPEAAKAGWTKFKFDQPTTPFQKNFNAIYAVDPMAAFAYGAQNNNSTEFKHAIDTKFLGAPYGPSGNSWPNSVGNAIINSFIEPGGSAGSQSSLGLDFSKTGAPQVTISVDGKIAYVNGRAVRLQ